MRSKRGMSIVELVVAMAVAAVAMLALFSGIGWLQRESVNATRDMSVKNDFSVVYSHLKRYLSPGTIRFYAFSGKTPTTSPSDRSLVRVLIPLVDSCADLSSCPGSSSMLYVSYDKTKTTSVTAICNIGVTAWVVDTKNTTYGQATFDGSSFKISGSADFPAETITLAPSQLLGLMNPPSVTLWRPGSATAMLTHKNSAGAWVYNENGSELPFPDACVAQLQGGATPDVSGLVKVMIQPASVAQFSGAQKNWTDADLLNSFGTFPMRLLPLSMRTVGKMTVTDSVTKKPKAQLSIRNCAFGQNDKIACDGPDFIGAGPLLAMNIEEAFATSLIERTDINRFEIFNTATGNWFPPGKVLDPAVPEVPTGNNSVSPNCDPAGCAGLPVTNPNNIPVLFGGTETAEALTVNGFSLFKQDYVQTIRLRLLIDPNHKDLVDVPVQ